MLTWLTYKSISFGGGKRLEITSLVDKCQACVLLELSTCTLVTKIRAVLVIKFLKCSNKKASSKFLGGGMPMSHRL